ncbi:MAG: hypothetical protein JXA82_00615 [Sedimentisphaerales bacterium]|nr:hypothetical protein [Sedimentisphaerales bacterium]
MTKDFETKLWHARIRCNLNLLLELTAWVLLAASLAALGIVLAEKLFAVDAVNPYSVYGLAAATLLGLAGFWAFKQPSRMQIAVLVDDRLRLHERFSTGLALAASNDPFARAACEEAHEKAHHVHIRDKFPIQPTKNWAYPVGMWVLVLALGLFLPQQDLLGFLQKQDQQQKLVKDVELAKATIKQATDPLKAAAKQLGDEDLVKELEKLDEASGTTDPAEIKREAIRKLGDLTEQVKKLQASKQLDSLEGLQQMLKQLRGSSDAISQELLRALGQGNFSQASELLTQLQKQLMDGKLTDEQKQALAKQFQELAKQLQAMSQQRGELEKELEKLGLDKKLANLNPQQLQNQLQKMGLNAQQIEDLMKKASACQGACNRAGQLAGAMAAAAGSGGGMSPDDLSQMIGQMDMLDDMRQQVQLSEAMLKQMYGACQAMGAGMCQGQGGYGPWQAGMSNRYGSGTGGPGQGYGARATDPDGQTGTLRTQLKNKDQEGPIVASWYFKDDQIKGETQRDLSEVVRAGRDVAAEAINENEIPRKYEDTVKKYFGQLEENSKEQQEQ